MERQTLRESALVNDWAKKEDAKMEKKELGKITHYFGKIGVAIIRLSDAMKVGDKISIEGAHTNFEQMIESIQIEHQSIPEAKAGDDAGIKVKEKVREGDTVYKVIE